MDPAFSMPLAAPSSGANYDWHFPVARRPNGNGLPSGNRSIKSATCAIGSCITSPCCGSVRPYTKCIKIFWRSWIGSIHISAHGSTNTIRCLTGGRRVAHFDQQVHMTTNRIMSRPRQSAIRPAASIPDVCHTPRTPDPAARSPNATASRAGPVAAGARKGCALFPPAASAPRPPACCR